MKLKKLFLTPFLIGILLIVLCATTSCATHEHSFSTWENIIEPTCSVFGVKQRVCSCGHVEYDTIQTLPHTPVSDEAIAATCRSFGLTEGSHCEVCNTIIVAQTQTAILLHSFSAWETVTEPTCTAFGLNKRVCECGYVEYDTTTPLSHTPITDEAVSATCTTYGLSEGSHCDTCGTILSAQSIIPATGHNCNEISITSEAFCNLDGIKRFSCSNTDCSYYYEKTYSIDELSGAEIYSNAVQYTGIIQTYDNLGFPLNQMSAFLISDDGIIVTSNRAFDNAFSAIFILGNTAYDVVEVLAYSETSNITVLKIDADNLPHANICTREPAAAETVYTVGAPEGFTSSISKGTISNTYRVYSGAVYIQHDADMEEGYYGGPLINRFGEVIGINIGRSDGEHVNLSVRIAEIETLDYSNPITVAQYGSATFTPIEEVKLWIEKFNTITGENAIAYILNGNEFYYTLGYHFEYNCCFVEGYKKLSDEDELYFCMFFNSSNGTYQYTSFLTDGVYKNEVTGFIDAATYNASTILTYDTYYGRYWTESDVIKMYSSLAYDTLGWLSYCFDTYFDNISLKSFGFTSVSYERDAEALDKLNYFVASQGNYDSGNEAYVLSLNSKYDDNDIFVDITYTPQTNDAPSTTTVTTYYYTADGNNLYVVSLSLNHTEYGNRIDFTYAVKNQTDFMVMNTAWGYVDANSLTAMGEITCYVFDGLNEYEDALLVDYSATLTHTMSILDMVMYYISNSLSIKDLGFLFYFG